MYPTKTMPYSNSPLRVAAQNLLNRCQQINLSACLLTSVRACLLGLGMLLIVCPTNSMAAAQKTANPPKVEAAPQAIPDEVTRDEKGFAVPRKGPMISELREDLDPDVPGPETVIRRYEDYKNNTVREFLINGMLFQIEVIPNNGPPYYLIDVEGNGLFQERYVGYQPRLVVPQWVLFRF